MPRSLLAWVVAASTLLGLSACKAKPPAFECRESGLGSRGGVKPPFVCQLGKAGDCGPGCESLDVAYCFVDGHRWCSRSAEECEVLHMMKSESQSRCTKTRAVDLAK